jgi:hypothetical protein
MSENQLIIHGKKKRRYNSYLGEISPAVPNLLARDFHADKPNEKWVTDLTEFQIPAGKVYLSPILDCFDGLVVSWSIGTSPDAELVNSMLDEGATCLSDDEHPILHTDRGSHYRWPGWILRMDTYGLIRSICPKKDVHLIMLHVKVSSAHLRLKSSTVDLGKESLWKSLSKNLIGIYDGTMRNELRCAWGHDPFGL